MGFADLVQTLRSTSGDMMGRVDVDDFLWVMMQQWAKHTEYVLKKTATKSAWALKNSLENKVSILILIVGLSCPVLSYPALLCLHYF